MSCKLSLSKSTSLTNVKPQRKNPLSASVSYNGKKSMRLKPSSKINRSFSQSAHTSSCLRWSIRSPVHWRKGCLGMRQGSIIAWENELNTKKTVKSRLKCLWSGFLLQQLYCSLEEIWPCKSKVQRVGAQVNRERGGKVGRLVDHSRGDPLHVKLPTPYNSTGCAQDGPSTAVPPSAEGTLLPPDTPQEQALLFLAQLQWLWYIIMPNSSC